MVVLEKGAYVPVQELSLQEGSSLAAMYDRGFLLSSEDVGACPSDFPSAWAGLGTGIFVCYGIMC